MANEFTATQNYFVLVDANILIYIVREARTKLTYFSVSTDLNLCFLERRLKRHKTQRIKKQSIEI